MSVRFAVAAFGSLLLSTSYAAYSDDDCLYANGVYRALPEGCRVDPIHLVGDGRIASAMRAIEVPETKIEMIGCDRADFHTSMTGDAGETRSFRIVYPILVDKDMNSYVAPITHELGHVYQLNAAGSLEALRESLHHSSPRIELGADFLAGLLFRRVMGDSDLNQFQANLQLVGDYKARTHGTPNARSAAFRSGFFYNKPNSNLADAHEEFQDDRFGEIMEVSGP